MGNNGSRPNYQVGLTKKEIERLQRRFARASRGRDLVSISDLQTDAHLENPFVHRAFKLFDDDNDGKLTLQEFTKAVDLLGNLSTEEEQMQFAFRMFNVGKTGFITEQELTEVLNEIVGRALSQPQLQQTVHSLVMTHDTDGDGQLSLPEFRALLAASNLPAIEAGV